MRNEQVIQQLQAEKIASHGELEKKENLIQKLQGEKDALHSDLLSLVEVEFLRRTTLVPYLTLESSLLTIVDANKKQKPNNE